MATHSSILAWRIPGAEEPGGLQSMGSQESDKTERLNQHHHRLFGGTHSSSLPIVSLTQKQRPAQLAPAGYSSPISYLLPSHKISPVNVLYSLEPSTRSLTSGHWIVSYLLFSLSGTIYLFLSSVHYLPARSQYRCLGKFDCVRYLFCDSILYYPLASYTFPHGAQIPRYDD